MDFVSPIITPIITPIVESLMVPIKKHLGFLVSSKENVKKTDDKIKQLNDRAKEVEATWKKAKENTERVPECVEPWLEDVKKLNERSDNLKETIGCFNMAKRYKVGKQSYHILEEITDLENRDPKSKFTHVQIPLAEFGSTSMSTKNDFKSRDLIFNDALQALKSDNESQKMIALCGMPGVGKTTMMEQLKKAVEDSKTFDYVVKVVIGETYDANSLQQAIAQYLTGKDLTESAKDARADRLRAIFKERSEQGNKILVIMDDLWKEFDLTDVGLSTVPNGFKMLFTSRFENVCTEMRVDLILKIRVLSNIEAKALFSKIVKPSPWDGDDAKLQSTGEEIVMKCGGLPIAIVTLAKILSGNCKEAWENTLWRLKQDDLKDLEKITHRLFEMSYENLEKDDDRAIFLLCGLFPDDFDIRTEDLLRYGWGLRFYKEEVMSLVIARSHMKESVNNLIRANLLTESDVNGCVKMHDLVRAFVLNSLSDVKQASIVKYENNLMHTIIKDANKSYDRILLKCTNLCEIPRDFNYSNLSLLILMDGNKLNKVFYERMEKIKVMSYEKLGFPLLPVMFEHSTNLRTIRLRSCLFIDNDISFFGGLHKLEILSLVDCHITRLPSSIGKLKKLKLLDINGCIDLCIDDGVIQNLGSLEELYLRNSTGARFTLSNYEELQKISQHLFVLEMEFIAWTPQKHCVSRQDKPQLKDMSFKNLEWFEISFGCDLERKHFEDYSFKKKLNLVATCNELQECNIIELFEKTEELELRDNDMYNLEDISNHTTFCQLRVFHVSCCANLTCLFTPDVANGLKKLERLTISECPVLKALVSKNSGVGVITFQKLNVMSLKDLPEMLTLCEDVIELPELLELTLCDLPKFTSIYHDGDSDISAMQSLLNKEVIMPKLELLDISWMKNLKQIWPCEISSDEKNDVSMLRRIEVWRCDSLVNLFPSNPLPLLNHLEELEVESCDSIEVLFNIDFEYVTRMGEYNSRLRSIKVENLGKINELWRMRGTNNSNVFSGFKGVESIKITDCPKFTNIFTPITTNFDLGALTTYITDTVGCDVEESCTQKKLLAERDEMIIMTYPSYLLHICHHLTRLELDDDERVKEVVFEMDSHQPLLLPCLENLKLIELKEMSHVWKCNWNKFFIHQHQLPFHNLKRIYIRSCPKLKYLLSPLMGIYLSNLKEIYIGHCYGIEEVISSIYEENEENTTSASSHQNTTLFPHLEALELVDLPYLMSIDGGGRRSDASSSNITNTIHDQSQQSGQVIGACWSLCQYPKQIKIADCDALSSLVPWYSVGQMKRLEELSISVCKRMKEVFESESSCNKLDEVISENGSTTLSAGPTLENITTLFVPELTNLKDVSISDCDLLSHVFTFSTLESLNQLKNLSVTYCKVVQVIVKEENIITSSKVVVKLPRLETLELDNLPNLEGFFLGMNEFRWPLLHDVKINDCPQLMVFTSGHSITPKLNSIRTRLGKYSTVECGLNFPGTINQTTFPASSSDSTVSKGMPWSFHNLIEINNLDRNVGRSIIPSNVLLQLEKLEKIELAGCYSVEEVFEVVAASEGQSGFDESQTTTPLIQIKNLKQVNLISMLDLKYLWKSNRSMVLEFPNLTTLSIQLCQSLEHVFTCSMVGSLVQLQDLHVSNCWRIEVIVKEEEESKNKLVKLPRLKSLKLECLSELKGFCLGKDAFSFPALDTLTIKECPEMTVFTRGDLSTPNLKVTDFGIFAINEDVNSVIETNQQEDSSSEDDALSSEDEET